MSALACALAPSAHALLVHLPNGQTIGIAPRPGITAASIPGARAPASLINFSSDGSMDYHGGPVLHSSAPYLVFWNGNSSTPVSTQSQGVLEQYLSDVAADSGHASNVYSVLRQYTDSTGFADYKQTFAAGSQAIVDGTTSLPAHCALITGVTHCVTDADIQTELNSLIAAHSLPTGTGANAPVYFMITPQDTNVCDGGACASDTFCAYHSSYVSGGNTILYAVIPFLVWATDGTKGCQTDGTAQYQTPTDPATAHGDHGYQIADNLSHELSETITDPVITSGGGTGWWNDFSAEEVGDNCATAGANDPNNGTSANAYLPTLGGSPTDGTLVDQLIHGDYYYNQTEWSNGDIGCQTQTSADTIVPRFTYTVPAVPGSSISFSPSATTMSPGRTASSATWDFGDGTSPAFSAAGLAAANHTFAHAGVYNVSLTLIDSVGNMAKVTQPVIVGNAPIASFTATPARAVLGASVSFNGAASSDPNQGGSISAYAWNFGDGSTPAAGATTRHTYARPGSFTVTLTVRDGLGLVQSTSHTETVLAPQITSATIIRRTVKVTVNGPGTVAIGSTRQALRAAGSVTVTVKLTKVQTRLLKRRHKLKLTVAVTFTPLAGPVQHRVLHTTLRH